MTREVRKKMTELTIGYRGRRLRLSEIELEGKRQEVVDLRSGSLPSFGVKPKDCAHPEAYSMPFALGERMGGWFCALCGEVQSTE